MATRRPRAVTLKASEPATDTEIATVSGAAFPIVGIGCSAGGLDALEKLLHHVPAQSGMAFVIVQHLDPVHVSALPALLQRATSMPVVEVSDGVPVQADHVYVIAPGKDLTILRGILYLLEPASARGLRLPIDFFLRSLADDQHERAIGVILSGMGADGVFGLRAIKAKAGLTLVQTPETAQFDSMPCSAIGADVADIVAIPEAIAGRIRDHFATSGRVGQSAAEDQARLQVSLDKIIVMLRDRSGNDFSQYKSNTLYRRIERRIALHQIASFADYVAYLRNNPQEADLLFRELLIGVTSFFRDPAVWEHLREQSFPALFQQFPQGKTLRAWVPACSTGEEAYSLAMSFREALDQIKPEAHFSLQIYATDLDLDAIDKARRGLYPANIVLDVPPELLTRYFTVEDGNYRISKEIREMVVFAQQNITADPPFTKLDILSCRNLLIYFGPALQKRLLPLFHYALQREGVLVLGSAETVGNFTDLFAPQSSKLRIFQRQNHYVQASELDFPARTAGVPAAASDATGLHAERAEGIGPLTDQLIQQTYAPAAVLVNADGDILYISGKTGKYLEPAAGKMNINIHAMARDGLREALAGQIRKALREPEPVRLRHVQIGATGTTQSTGTSVDVTLQAIEKPEALRGRVIIVFTDVASPPPARRVKRGTATAAETALTDELTQMREALQVAREEMQTSMEELKSSNEELQSTNEELQSSNEELVTSKEELQSMNEEMQTVNAELTAKVDDLTWVRNDMANLLNSIDIATIFLDNDMNLRRFTPYATRLFKLIPGDVGRPLSDIVTDLDYPQLQEDARNVARTLVFQEKQVTTRDGRWYRARVMPYRTSENLIDGVVATFMDITAIKALEGELRAQKT